MFFPGIRFTLARTRSQRTEGNPRRSSDTTATEVSPLRKTIARAVSSPRFSFAGLGAPIPPETGRSGSGVMTRFAAPTWISARAGPARATEERQTQANTTRRIMIRTPNLRGFRPAPGLPPRTSPPRRSTGPAYAFASRFPIAFHRGHRPLVLMPFVLTHGEITCQEKPMKSLNWITLTIVGLALSVPNQARAVLIYVSSYDQTVKTVTSGGVTSVYATGFNSPYGMVF